MSESNKRRDSDNPSTSSSEGILKNKKARYSTHFQDSWKQNPQYKNWLVKIDQFIAKCSICNIRFT